MKKISMSANFGCFAFVIFTAISLVSGCGSPEKHSSDRHQEVATKFEQAQLRNQEALVRFESDFAKLEMNYRSRFSAAARDASEKIAERQAILVTVYFLTKDKIFGGNETEGYLEQIVGPSLKSVTDSYQYEIDKLAGSLDRELRSISIDFATELGFPSTVRVTDGEKLVTSRVEWKDFDHALEGLGYIAPNLGARALTNIDTAIGSKAMAAFVGPIKKMAARIFAKSVIRIATTTSAAIFEGPMPIGKIVAAASSFWTAYELAQLQPIFQAEVLASTSTTFDAIKGQIDKSTKASAVVRVAVFDKLLVNIRTQVHQ